MSDVICCFCGKCMEREKAVELSIWTEEMEDESQALFAHKDCFVNSIDSSVPLHPDLYDE